MIDEQTNLKFNILPKKAKMHCHYLYSKLFQRSITDCYDRVRRKTTSETFIFGQKKQNDDVKGNTLQLFDEIIFERTPPVPEN